MRGNARAHGSGAQDCGFFDSTLHHSPQHAKRQQARLQKRYETVNLKRAVAPFELE
jgi:hypothetical protein